jgi:hypothetical protein
MNPGTGSSKINTEYDTTSAKIKATGVMPMALERESNISCREFEVCKE